MSRGGARGVFHLRVALLALLLFAAAPACAGQVHVAVAANFSAVAEELAAAFERKTGNEVVVSAGATGALYAQITQGAPYDVFLAADNKRPLQSVDNGYGVEGTVFTYAIGKLVLFSPSVDVGDGEAALREGRFQHLAIADPASAPFGAAAIAVIEGLGLTEQVEPKLVTGQSIAQALQFVDSGNAELGFVALSEVIGRTDGSRWMVPQELYPPIIQDAVLLKTGAGNATARDFLEFLRSAEGRAIIARYGYDTERE